jgi:hypothetical protein
LVRALPCHGRGYGFEPRHSRHPHSLIPSTYRDWASPLRPFVTTGDLRAENFLFSNGMNAKAHVPPEQKAEKPKSRFRVELTRHNHRVVITDSIDKGRNVSYVVSYYVEGRRKQVRRASLAEAKREAGFILTKIAQGEPDVLALTSTDRLIYLRACETLSKTNVPLDVAVSQYVDAETLLKGIGMLTDAARFFVRQHAGLVGHFASASPR